MRKLLSTRTVPVQSTEQSGYQEFRAGAIPVSRTLALVLNEPLVLIEHQRGYQLAFDRHLDAMRRGHLPSEDVEYLARWMGITEGPAGPPLVRLDLEIDGLRARVRLLFAQRWLAPLWLLADGAQLGLIAASAKTAADAVFKPAWLLGRTPEPRDLRQILQRCQAPNPPPLLMRQARKNRRLGRLRTPRRSGALRAMPTRLTRATGVRQFVRRELQATVSDPRLVGEAQPEERPAPPSRWLRASGSRREGGVRGRKQTCVRALMRRRTGARDGRSGTRPKGLVVARQPGALVLKGERVTAWPTGLVGRHDPLYAGTVTVCVGCEDGSHRGRSEVRTRGSPKPGSLG